MPDYRLDISYARFARFACFASTDLTNQHSEQLIQLFIT